MTGKQTLRIAILTAGMGLASLSGVSRAQDAGAQPAPAGQPPAQPPQQRRRPSPADMLKNYRDQFEGVDLTDDQMKKIDGFLDTAQKGIKDLKDDQESRQQARDIFTHLNEDVQSVLTDSQKQAMRAKRQQQFFDRFKQTYTNPDLKLTDDQLKKVNEALDAAKKKLADLNSQTGAQEDRRKMFQIMRETTDSLNAILTPEQQKQVPQFGRGRGGPGGPGGPGGRPPGGAGGTPPGQ